MITYLSDGTLAQQTNTTAPSATYSMTAATRVHANRVFTPHHSVERAVYPDATTLRRVHRRCGIFV